MGFRTPLARVRGLGSSHSGVHHWWRQRVTAVALVPLGLWFGVAIAALPGASYPEVAAWLGRPVNTIMLIALVAAGCYHGALGLRVVVEDYVHSPWRKVAVIMGIDFIFALVALAALFACVRIAALG